MKRDGFNYSKTVLKTVGELRKALRKIYWEEWEYDFHPNPNNQIAIILEWLLETRIFVWNYNSL